MPENNRFAAYRRGGKYYTETAGEEQEVDQEEFLQSLERCRELINKFRKSTMEFEA